MKIARVEGAIRRWKKVVKYRLREKEVREEDESGREVRKVKKELESEEGDAIVDTLCQVGSLVPLARK